MQLFIKKIQNFEKEINTLQKSDYFLANQEMEELG